MSVAAPKTDQDERSLGPRLVMKHRSADAPSMNVAHRAHEMIHLVRDILTWEGLSESTCADEAGFYFIIENCAEVAIHYNEVEQPSATDVHTSDRHEFRLLECCRALAERGFALTLFLSDRTCTLHVRDE